MDKIKRGIKTITGSILLVIIILLTIKMLATFLEWIMINDFRLGLFIGITIVYIFQQLFKIANN